MTHAVAMVLTSTLTSSSPVAALLLIPAIAPTIAAEEEAPRSPDVRPPTPGNPSPAPAVEPPYSQGVHKIDLPLRETSSPRPVIPVDQLEIFASSDTQVS